MNLPLLLLLSLNTPPLGGPSPDGGPGVLPPPGIGGAPSPPATGARYMTCHCGVFDYCNYVTVGSCGGKYYEAEEPVYDGKCYGCNPCPLRNETVSKTYGQEQGVKEEFKVGAEGKVLSAGVTVSGETVTRTAFNWSVGPPHACFVSAHPMTVECNPEIKPCGDVPANTPICYIPEAWGYKVWSYQQVWVASRAWKLTTGSDGRWGWVNFWCTGSCREMDVDYGVVVRGWSNQVLTRRMGDQTFHPPPAGTAAWCGSGCAQEPGGGCAGGGEGLLPGL